MPAVLDRPPAPPAPAAVPPLAADSAAGTPARRPAASLPRRLLLGRPDAPWWERPATLGLVLLTALLYLWGLGRNGDANSYYTAAVLAATKSRKAFFFGSFDAGNFITVDKPPLSLWVMALSARLFGLNAWSVLAPQALEGVAAVGLLSRLVRRWHGPAAGLLAGLTLAVTPVAALMFRFNNPDALLTLLLVLAALTLQRAVEGGRTRWLLASAAFVGLGFNVKFLQADLIVPALALTFLVAAPGGWWRRVGQLLAAGAALLVSSGWWPAIVDAIPAADRPFIGGSTNNMVLNLVLGYNGIGRITGAEGGPGGPGGGGGGPNFGGVPGLLRLFNAQIGGQNSWLLPLALLGLLAGLWLHRRAPRSNHARAGYLLWGSWLLVHAAVFSAASGILHPYYTVAMAPALAALVGAGLVDLWALRRASWAGGLPLAAAIVGCAVWADRLLARTPAFLPWLAPAVVAAAAVAAAVLLLPRRPALTGLQRAAVGLALVALLAGPTAYTLDTVGSAVQGSTPSAGPAVRGGFGGPPPFAGNRGNGFGPPPSAAPAAFGGSGTAAATASGNRPAGAPSATSLGGAPAGNRGGPGGDQADAALIAYLEQHQGGATWLVATGSANQAAPIQIASGRPVLAMGGFSGTDQAMTVDRLQALVASGKLRYVLLGGGPGGPGGGSQAVSAWIQQHGTAVNYGGSSSATLYDLAAVAKATAG